MKNVSPQPELKQECYFCKKFWSGIKNNGDKEINCFRYSKGCNKFKRVAG